MGDLCIHEVSHCTICTPLLDPGTARREGGTSRMFVARYESRCGLCHFDVREGDGVRFADGVVCHVGCADV